MSLKNHGSGHVVSHPFLMAGIPRINSFKMVFLEK